MAFGAICICDGLSDEALGASPPLFPRPGGFEALVVGFARRFRASPSRVESLASASAGGYNPKGRAWGRRPVWED